MMYIRVLRSEGLPPEWSTLILVVRYLYSNNIVSNYNNIIVLYMYEEEQCADHASFS